jgi:hypothetical protein
MVFPIWMFGFSNKIHFKYKIIRISRFFFVFGFILASWCCTEIMVLKKMSTNFNKTCANENSINFFDVNHLCCFLVYMHDFIRLQNNRKNLIYFAFQIIDHLHQRYFHCCMLPCQVLLLTSMLVDDWPCYFNDCDHKQMLMLNYE